MCTITSRISWLLGSWEKVLSGFTTASLVASLFIFSALSAQEEVDWTDTRVTVLHRAAQHGHFAVAQAEINRGVDVNAPDRWQATPLHRAARYGKKAVVKLLIAHGALVNAQDCDERTPLYLAANSLLHEPQQLDIVKLLVQDYHADVTQADNFGRTVLHQAVEWNKDIVVFLVENGASVHAKNKTGMTPLHRAAEKGKLPIVEFLIHAGAIVDVCDEFWHRTPLHQAVLGGHENVMRFLVEKGADVNALSKYHGCVLHCAVARGHSDLVRYLVEAGARTDICDADNKTPLEVALMLGHQDIVQVLADAIGTLDQVIAGQIKEKFVDFAWSKITVRWIPLIISAPAESKGYKFEG